MSEVPQSAPGDGARLTGNGRGLLFAGVLLVIAGPALGYPELLALGVAALLLPVVGAAQLLRRPQLTVRREVAPHKVTRHGTAMGLLEVRNRGRWRSPAVVAVDRVGDRREPIDVRTLRGGTMRRLVYPLDTSRRGVFDVGPLVLEQHDLFGLAVRRRELGSVETLWVHPSVHHLKPPPGGLSQDLDGPEVRSSGEGSVTFSGLREYVPGDDLRKVHWSSFARTGTLLVRTHADTARPELLVLLDDRAERYPRADDFEEAVSFAASVAVAAARAGFPVRVALVSGGAALTGDAAVLLDALAGLQPAATAPRLAVAARLAGRGRGGSCAVAVLGSDGVSEIGELAVLRRSWKSVIAATVTGRSGSARHGGIDVLAGAGAARLADAWNGRRWT